MRKGYEQAHADDLHFARLRGRIQVVYAEAERDLRKKLEAFVKRYKEQDKIKRQQLAAGEITQQQYEVWLHGQVFQGERWKSVKQSAVDQIYRANQTATELMNDERKALFQDGANYSAFQIEKGTKGAIRFDLYDNASVTRLLKDNPKMLPDLKIGKRKDESWNRRGIQNAITQGIIQGESIPDIAKRIGRETGERNRKAMIRQARTAMTGAQNAGRVAAMIEAKEKGIHVKKRWIATLDSKTRDAHAELDGQEVDPEEPFVVNGMQIMEPGDANADPSLVYNCRCTVGWVYPDYPATEQRRDNETGEIIEGQTYKEWAKKKKEVAENELLIAKQNGIIGSDEQIPSKYKGDFSDFSSLTLDADEKKSLDILHGLAVKNGYEYGSGLADGVYTEPFTSYKVDMVQIPQSLLQKKGIQLYHSHTNATLLSAKDFELLTNPNVEKVSVKAINGDIYSAYIGDGYRPTRDEFREVEKEIRKDVDTSMIDDPDFFSWTIAQRQYMCIREEAYRLARHFGWTLEGGRE